MPLVLAVVSSCMVFCGYMCLQTLSADSLLGMCCYDAEPTHVLRARSVQTRDMARARLYDLLLLTFASGVCIDTL